MKLLDAIVEISASRQRFDDVLSSIEQSAAALPPLDVPVSVSSNSMDDLIDEVTSKLNELRNEFAINDIVHADDGDGVSTYLGHLKSSVNDVTESFDDLSYSASDVLKDIASVMSDGMSFDALIEGAARFASEISGIGAVAYGVFQIIRQEGESTSEAIARIGMNLFGASTQGQIDNNIGTQLSERISAASKAIDSRQLAQSDERTPLQRQVESEVDALTKLEHELIAAKEAAEDFMNGGNFNNFFDEMSPATREGHAKVLQEFDSNMEQLKSRRAKLESERSDLLKQSVMDDEESERARADSEKTRQYDLQYTREEREKNAEELRSKRIASKVEMEEREIARSKANNDRQLAMAADRNEKFAAKKRDDLSRLAEEIEAEISKQEMKPERIDYRPRGMVGSPETWRDLLQNALVSGAEAREKVAESQRERMIEFEKQAVERLGEIAARRPTW